MHVDSVLINPKDRCSLSYARCREAIHQDRAEMVQKYANVAKGIIWEKGAKSTALEFLGGTIQKKHPKQQDVMVVFTDGSKARY